MFEVGRCVNILKKKEIFTILEVVEAGENRGVGVRSCENEE
jgi:hypothetical protein